MSTRLDEIDALAARHDRGQQPLGRIGEQQEDGLGRRFLERLQKGVRARRIETFRRHHDTGLPTAGESGLRHRIHQPLVHGFHRNDTRLQFRRQPVDVGMGAILHMLRAKEPRQHAFRQFQRGTTHVADDQIPVRRASDGDGVLDERIGCFNVHGGK